MNGFGVVFIERLVCDNAVYLRSVVIWVMEYRAGKVMTNITCEYRDGDGHIEEAVLGV